jgi:hypothetical protein
MGQVVTKMELLQQYEVRIGHRLSAQGVYFYRFSGQMAWLPVVL